MTATTSKLGADMLTDEQILEIAREYQTVVPGNCLYILEFARALLARRPAAIDKEAVEGYAFRSDGKLWIVTDPVVAMKWQEQGFQVTPVHAAPSVEQDERGANHTCQTCKGLGVVDDGEITGSGGVN